MEIIKKRKMNAALSLIEVILAMVILASAFIPIIGVMGTAAKATDKDNRTIKAMDLCQDKLNKALQFPFDDTDLANTLNPRGSVRKFGEFTEVILTSGQIKLRLGPGENIDGVIYDSMLVSTDATGTFHVPMYDAFAKGVASTTPSSWNWADKEVDFERVFSKYAVTVKWKDQANRSQHYTLVSFKAKTRTD